MNIKSIYFFLRIKLFVVLIMLLGCGSKDDSSDNLKVDISSSAATIIPSTTPSCDEVSKNSWSNGGSIKNYFEISTPTFTWLGSANSEVRVEVLKFTVETAQLGKFECTLASTTLGLLYYKSGKDVNGNAIVSAWDLKLGYNSTDAITSTSELKAKSYSSCSIRCGGVAVKEGSGKFTAKGKWELLAIEKRYNDAKTSYEEVPLKVTGDFSVQNPF
ncbi:MAG: hypothetical protein HUU56_00360 [Bdellovibrionaceae bacterium]|nr:hypothetical protein [Pseudobdellovibrionaceae bacterium]